MQFRVLGPLEVLDEGLEGVPIRRGRPRSLLHLLLINRRVVVGADTLVDRLWGEDVPVDSANAVQQLISYLRRSLGPRGHDRLRTTPSGYRIDVADEELDAAVFETLVRRAADLVGDRASASLERALATIDDATTLWRGEPYAESAHHDWAEADVARLKDLYLQAQEVRMDGLLGLGRHREVVLEAKSLVAAYPLHERFHAQLALALYRCGRQSEALEVHRAVRAVLAEELGLDPGPGLRALEQQILSQDAVLDWSESTVATTSERRRPSPPATGPARRPSPLPTIPTRAFGIEDTVADTAALLRPGRVLTVVGPAGVGKTRLCVELARQAADPVWFVDLEEVEDDELVASAVADRLGLAAGVPHDPLDRLAEAFAAPSTGMLVLDRCEHVVEGAAALASTLTDRCPGLTLLASSRRPLEIVSEVVYLLEPLPLPPGDDVAALARNPAVQLFVDRARSVRSGTSFDDDGMRRIGDIVRIVDGLPLAVELAASHLDILSPDSVHERLQRSIVGLEVSTRDPGRRRTSLRAAIESSVVLLTAAEAEHLRRLSVFPAHFDLAAAVAVLAPADDPVAAVGALVRQSLLHYDGRRQYRLLAPVREYARDLLDRSGELDDTMLRYARHVVECADEAAANIRGARQQEELDRLGALLPDARAVLGWSLAGDHADLGGRLAVSLAWYWTMRGLSEEGRFWLARAEAAPLREPIVRAAVLRRLGLVAGPLGELELVKRVCAESAAISLEIGDDEGRVGALLDLGIAEWAMGDLDAAAAAHDAALELLGPSSQAWMRCSALTLRARTALDRGEEDVDERIALAMRAATQYGERQLMGLALALQSRRLLAEGLLPQALLMASEALTTWRPIGYTEGELSALNLIGRIHVLEGDVRTGEGELLRALSIAHRARHRGSLCETLESLAFAARAAGRPEHAFMLLEVADHERARHRIVRPATFRSDLEDLVETVRAALGASAPLIEARASLVHFDDFVSELAATAPAEGGADEPSQRPDHRDSDRTPA